VTSTHIVIELASSERWEDIVAAFGRATKPSSCWCQRLIGSPPDGNREGALRAQVDAATIPFGLIAYVDGRPAGWSRVAPRASLPGVSANRALQRVLEPDPDAWWMTCFTVQPQLRGRGVARALLRAAVAHATRNGASALEGHPVDVQRLQASKVSGSALFTGTLRTFLAEGFSEIGRTYPTRPVMRRELSRSARTSRTTG